MGGWVKHPVLRLQAVTQRMSSSFCCAFLEPPALESPGSSGTQTESRSLSGAAGAGGSRREVPVVRALSSLLTCSTFGGVSADEAVLFALTRTAPRARAFRSCLGLLLNMEGEGSVHRPGEEKVARAPLSLLLPSLEALGGAGQLSDKICFPGDCREQSPERKQLVNEVVCLAAEIDAMQKVIMHSGKEGWDSRAPHKALPGPARGLFLLGPGTHPIPTGAAC